jgi:hypothetical protein
MQTVQQEKSGRKTPVSELFNNNRGFGHESAVNKSIEWYTPSYIFDAMGIGFDLDPCSPGSDVVSWIPAKRHLTIADNGLNAEWAGRVWLNPPYGKETGKWLAKLAEHGSGIALVFARTDTQWFHKYATKADVICFVKKRIPFVRSDGERAGSPGAGSMLLGYGRECKEAVVGSGLGFCVEGLL